MLIQLFFLSKYQLEADLLKLTCQYIHQGLNSNVDVSDTRGQYCSIKQINTAEIVLNVNFCANWSQVFSLLEYLGKTVQAAAEKEHHQCECNLTHLNTRNTSSDLNCDL